jgi:hypothetical protein
MRPVETIPGIVGGVKGGLIRGWVQLWHVIRTFANVTMYLPYSNSKK